MQEVLPPRSRKGVHLATLPQLFAVADARAVHPLPRCSAVLTLFGAERVKAAGISSVVVGEAILKEEDPAKVAEALLL